MFRKMLVPLLAVGLVGIVTAQQEAVTIDTAMNARIREEGMKNSQIMRTMHYLTDVYGPRLTGSPNHENAAKWAVKQMESWGIKNGKLEPWDFWVGNEKTVREGWLNEKATRPHPLAGQGQPRVRGAGVDAVDERHGDAARPCTSCAPQGPTVENAGGRRRRPRRHSVSARHAR